MVSRWPRTVEAPFLVCPRGLGPPTKSAFCPPIVQGPFGLVMSVPVCLVPFTSMLAIVLLVMTIQSISRVRFRLVTYLFANASPGRSVRVFPTRVSP